MGVGVFSFPSFSYIVLFIVAVIIIIPVLGRSHVFHYVCTYIPPFVIISLHTPNLERLFCYYSNVSECAHDTDGEENNNKKKNEIYIIHNMYKCNTYLFYSVHGLPLSTAAALSEMDSAFYLERQYKTTIFIFFFFTSL